MKTKTLVLLTLLGLTILSCSKFMNGESEIFIRIHNVSAYQMSNIILNGQDYGKLEPGEISMYKKHELIYGIAFVSLYVEDSNIQIIPFDYVGEKPLPPGKYSWVLGLDADQNLLYEIKED